MNLFEPPSQECVLWPQVTVRRVAVSLARGAALGVAASGLIFAFEWSSAATLAAANESSGLLPVVTAYGAWLVIIWIWRWGALQAARGLLTRARLAWTLSVLGWVAAGGYLLVSLSRVRFAPWFFTHPEFTTLVILCGVVGVVALWLVLRQSAIERARVSLWFAAAGALWLMSGWLVRLGPAMDRWDDPRYDIATFTVFGTGVFVVVGVLALMDWHMRWRDAISVRDSEAAHNGVTRG